MTIALLVAGVVGGAAVLGAVAAARRRFVVVSVRGPSMAPTLVDGQRVLVRRCPPTAVGRGHLVVFTDPRYDDWDPRPPEADEWQIKRAAAVPGDPVPRTLWSLADADHDVVPPGSYVLLGDNAARSDDSRRYGYVRAEFLVGRVVRVLG